MMSVRKQITQWARRCANGLRAVSSIFCSLTLAIALSLLTSTPVASQELVRLPIFGGYGGNDFEYICGPGRVLVGVRGYTGVWIDNVQAVCARVDANGVVDAQREGPVFGGDRPLTNFSTCYHLSTADYLSTVVVAGLEADVNKDKRFLGYIRPVCADFISRNFLPKPVSMGMRGTGLLASEPSGTTGSELFVKPARQECPAGTVALGIRGRAGQFLDALGLVCGPKPPPARAGRPIGKIRLGKPGQTNDSKGATRKKDAGSDTVSLPRTDESRAEPSRPAPPFITASPQAVVISPRRDQGTTTLTWDGGPNHPYAEVWVKVDDADETFVVEQGKGTRQMPVHVGNTYLFILTDAGQRLATITVTVTH